MCRPLCRDSERESRTWWLVATFTNSNAFSLMSDLLVLSTFPTMDRHHYYSVGEDSPSSILWDLDSSSLIVPACYRPYQPVADQTSCVRREISEESGYHTSSGPEDWTTLETPASFTCPPPPPPPSDLHPVDDYWLQQEGIGADECWGIPSQTSSAISQEQQPEQQPPSGRSGSTSSDESDVYVPSGIVSFAVIYDTITIQLTR